MNLALSFLCCTQIRAHIAYILHQFFTLNFNGLGCSEVRYFK